MALPNFRDFLGNLRTGSRRVGDNGVPTQINPPAAPQISSAAAPTAYDPLDPFDITQMNSRGNALRNQYGQAKARNAYAQTQLGIKHQMAQDELGQQFYDYRQQLPGGFAGRGLLTSGLYKHALARYSQRKLQGQNKLQFEYQDQLGQLSIEDLGIEGNLTTGLSGIEAEKQARRAQLAAQLRELA